MSSIAGAMHLTSSVALFAQESFHEASDPYEIPSRVVEYSHLKSFGEYKKLYNESIQNPETFWRRMANETLTWFQPFDKVTQGGFEEGDIAWFLNGKLNLSYNCIDRHIDTKGDEIAIIWEGDEPSDVKSITYRELQQEVCKVANLLRSYGVRKGDCVAIYLPNCPEAAYAMLACARIGAIHSVIFAGFSADAIAARIQDCEAKVLFTSDEFTRGGRLIQLKKIADEALHTCSSIKKVVVLQRNERTVLTHPDREVFYHEATSTQRPYCPCEVLDSEDPLFLLYTSGSTGKPKGMVHTQAGYLLMAALTHKYVFDYHDGDIYACVADIGWITGHSYVVYGPLANGATTFMFESIPTYPNEGRYWDCVERHKITQLYTAPTAIRALMKYGVEAVRKYNKSSLRILGSVGEPINPEAWKWYNEEVGEKRCAIVDTYWQTESGAHLIAPLPGATETKPGSASFPFFGIKPEIIHPESALVLPEYCVTGVLAISKPWPSIARTIYGDHERYLSTYMQPYPGFYFTGDRASRDEHGFYWIGGRIDDVINVSGHRLGTAEIESALVSHPACAEAAVIAIPHEIKGQAIWCYCILRNHYSDRGHADIVAQELKLQVRKNIGPFATPDAVVIVPGLPKTRSGKIMRRVLRKIATKETSPEQLGDISTLAEPAIVEQIIAAVNDTTAPPKTPAAVDR